MGGLNDTEKRGFVRSEQPLILRLDPRTIPRFMLSVGVIGARRKRQGIGEHVARDFARHGAEVRAIVGTTPETVAEACRTLQDRHGIRCRGYTRLEAMLDAEPIGALVVCSPIAAHREALDAALRRKLHVLCEKPLLFDRPDDFGAEVNAVARGFAKAGRYLGTVTQWPQTLGAFRRLHPEVNLDSVRQFGMLLSPTARGVQMLADSLPHPISMLRALAGEGTVRNVSTAWGGDDQVVLRFRYDGARTAIESEVILRRCLEQPRPASYTIDGREASREVRLSDYAMEFVGDGRRVALEDPLGMLVRDFIERVGRGCATEVDGLTSDAVALQTLVHEAAPGA